MQTSIIHLYKTALYVSYHFVVKFIAKTNNLVFDFNVVYTARGQILGRYTGKEQKIQLENEIILPFDIL